MSDVGVLLVGAGRAGRVHGRNFAAGVRGARLLAVADVDRDAAEDAAEELGVDEVSTDPEAAIRDPEVEGVVITTPTFTHADLAVTALEAGKHVLCEKPLASSVEDAQRVADAVDAADSSFVMAFMRRFDPRFTRVRERIDAGDIGDPILVRSTGRGPGLPPEWAWDTDLSGGLIAEVNSHDLDTVRWFSGQEFRTVHAFGRAAKRPDIADEHPDFVDVLVANYELSEGGLAAVDGACPADYGYDARTEVLGTDGVILVGSPLKDAPLLVRDKDGHVDAVRTWRNLFSDAYRAEDRHFVRVVRGEEEPRVTVEDGVRALEAVAATNVSLSEGGTVSIEDVRAAA